jgi:hypothetical protein
MTAPLVSRTTPLMALCAEAALDSARNSPTMPSRRTEQRIMRVPFPAELPAIIDTEVGER